MLLLERRWRPRYNEIGEEFNKLLQADPTAGEVMILGLVLEMEF